MQALQTEFPCGIAEDALLLQPLKHAKHYGSNIRKQKKRIVCMQQEGTLCSTEFCEDERVGKTHVQNQFQRTNGHVGHGAV